jgi:DNA repair exonuclease SbcCD nuclease subunit
MQPFKFLHIADVHLGFKQYNLEERFRDFNRAFRESLKVALDENVDFVLIAGDLFQDNKVNPDTLSAIYMLINKFKQDAQNRYQRDIPIIAIEGNHDMGSHLDSRSWMQFLSELGLIILLQGRYDKETDCVVFDPVKKSTNRGGMIQIKDCCIYGVNYYGSYVEKIMPLIEKGLPDNPDCYNILMMHFGLSKEVKNEFGVDIGSSNLQDLHQKIDYLALGHFHKQYIRPTGEEWIFNPGSLELNEIADLYEGYERGMFVVTIKGKNPEDRSVKKILAANGPAEREDQYPNRHFISIKIDIGLSKLGTFQQTLDYIIDYVRKNGVPYRDSNKEYEESDMNYLILHVFLIGTISYSKLELNFKKIQETLKDLFAVLDVRVSSSNIDSQIDGIVITTEDDYQIQHIETQVFEQILEKNPEYSKDQETLIPLLQDLKTALLDPLSSAIVMRDQIKTWWKGHRNPGLSITETKPVESPPKGDTTLVIDENKPITPTKVPDDNAEKSEKKSKKTKKSTVKKTKVQSLDELFDDLDFEKKI